MNEGTIQPLEGRSLIRFERRYPHSVERVWAALTESEQLQQWFGEGDIELVGGGEETLGRHDTVLQVDPPRLLEHTFYGGESVVRWELLPDGAGCLLRLTHTIGAAVGADSALALAGWHTLFDLLGPLLDVAPEPWTRAGWNRNHEIYVERAGR